MPGEGILISRMYVRHVLTLAFRCILLAAALYFYISGVESLDFTIMPPKGCGGVFLAVVWIALIIGMLGRIVPNKQVAMGARKHFASSYRAAPDAEKASGSTIDVRKRMHKGSLASLLACILFNSAVFLFLSVFKMLTPAALLIVLLFYAVCDIVCILFFCPFRVFLLHNRCCTVCRIYNWDYFMICAPLILFPSAYSMSLILLSAAVLLRWEIAMRRNPPFFIEECNQNLRCEQCKDALCLTQLMSKRRDRG